MMIVIRANKHQNGRQHTSAAFTGLNERALFFWKGPVTGDISEGWGKPRKWGLLVADTLPNVKRSRLRARFMHVPKVGCRGAERGVFLFRLKTLFCAALQHLFCFHRKKIYKLKKKEWGRIAFITADCIFSDTTKYKQY